MTQSPPSDAVAAVLAGLDDLDWLEDTYKDFHAHPELSHSETRSAAICAAKLQELGYEVTEQIGGTGVVGVIRNGEGPTVMFRADMDGLPVREETGLPYASTDTGTDDEGHEHPTMHACGHDFHMTWLLGAAELLAAGREHWSGTFIALFQPAEETGDGAIAMVEDGLVDRVPRPEVVLGQHVGPARAGSLHLRPGPTMSRSENVKIVVHGKGGHGSMPHFTIDPVVVASSIVMNLQTIVSRTLSAAEFGVVTVGQLHSGTKANIIPATAELHLNIRSYDDEVHARIIAAITRIANGQAAAAGCPSEPEITYYDQVPLTDNDPEVIARLWAALEASGEEMVEGELVTGSEDFSWLPRAWDVPYGYWFVGGWDQGAYDTLEAQGRLLEVPSNHSPFFGPAINPTLHTGVRSAVTSSLTFLGEPA